MHYLGIDHTFNVRPLSATLVKHLATFRSTSLAIFIYLKNAFANTKVVFCINAMKFH